MFAIGMGAPFKWDAVPEISTMPSPPGVAGSSFWITTGVVAVTGITCTWSMLRTAPLGRCETKRTMSPGRVWGGPPAQHTEGGPPLTLSTPPTEVAWAIVLIVTGG